MTWLTICSSGVPRHGCGWNNVVDLLLVAVSSITSSSSSAERARCSCSSACLCSSRLRRRRAGCARAHQARAAGVVRLRDHRDRRSVPTELRRVLGRIGQLGPLNASSRRFLKRKSITSSTSSCAPHCHPRRNMARSSSRTRHRPAGLQRDRRPDPGKLTAELLASIFMTRSPLHDGAVIVRQPDHRRGCPFSGGVAGPRAPLRHAPPRGALDQRADRRGRGDRVGGDAGHQRRVNGRMIGGSTRSGFVGCSRRCFEVASSRCPSAARPHSPCAPTSHGPPGRAASTCAGS